MAEFDVVVCGAGMAGLAAAVEAVDRGARVLVLEKQGEIGGSAAISSGYLWTAPDVATFAERIPLADRRLGEVLVGAFEEAAGWVRATGVEMSSRVGDLLGFGTGYVVDIRGLFARWCAKIESAGGWIVRETAATGLISCDRGVGGVTASGGDGLSRIPARAVVLATGGFQGDRALRSQHIGRGADEMLVRSSPGCVGDGYLMAREVRAGASSGLSAFYGHLVPSPLEELTERDFLPFTQYHSNHCVLVNRHGRRFMDEKAGDEHANQRVFREAGQRAVLLADERIRRDHVIAAPYERGEAVDRFALAAAAGARLAIESSFEDLASSVSAWGVDENELMRTLDAQTILSEPPYYALEVQPTITFTHGGILIDDDARVLDRDRRRIPGLYAAGADAGGVFNQGYAGGLAAALVFGRRAGRQSAEWATDPHTHSAVPESAQRDTRGVAGE